jgi:hypothetical protein
VWAAERKLEFQCNDYFDQLTRLFQAAATSPAQPARIGRFDGVQFLVGRPGPRAENQAIYRWASMPQGGQVSIEYTPLIEASHGDMDLFDAVCEAVRVDGSELPRDPQETLAHAGVRFPIAADWQVFGAQDRSGPGLWVQRFEGNRPVWALAVFRREFPRRSAPIDVLADDLLLAESRRLMPRSLRPEPRFRNDGTYVAFTRNVGLARTGSVVVSVWVVVKSRAEAAVVYALAAPLHSDAANDAARQLAETIDFISDSPR